MSSYESLIDKTTAQQNFRRRLLQYMTNNIGFSIYYDKVHKKEYLPSRVRYNQFFFYAAAFYLYLRLRQKRQMFVDENQNNLGLRKYYTSARSYQNTFAAQRDLSNLRSHTQQQNYIF